MNPPDDGVLRIVRNERSENTPARKAAPWSGLMTSAPWVKRAAAKESIVVVEWGSNYIEATKDLAGKQDKVDIAWELHAGGSAAILAKIKANWPQVRYDLVA